MRANDEIGDDAFHQIEEELDWLEMAARRQGAVGDDWRRLFTTAVRETGADMVTRSTYPSITIPDLAISQFMLDSHDAATVEAALIDGSTNRVITYAALRDDVRRIGGGLLRLGVTAATSSRVRAELARLRRDVLRRDRRPAP